MLKTLFEEKEQSSVLPSMKNVEPSAGTPKCEGVDDRSDVGKAPEAGQKKVLGNLAGQATGMTGELDTQGKGETKVFPKKTTEITEKCDTTSKKPQIESAPTELEKSAGKKPFACKTLNESTILGASIVMLSSRLINESLKLDELFR